ncbi:unnamed protein product, partial [Effrenium voratum]
MQVQWVLSRPTSRRRSASTTCRASASEERRAATPIPRRSWRQVRSRASRRRCATFICRASASKEGPASSPTASWRCRPRPARCRQGPTAIATALSFLASREKAG